MGGGHLNPPPHFYISTKNKQNLINIMSIFLKSFSSNKSIRRRGSE